MATISMSTNSASTSNNGGTGNKQLRGSLVTLQNDIDLADAILQNGGTALAANDIIEAIAVPANTLILHAGFEVVTAMAGTTTDLRYTQVMNRPDIFVRHLILICISIILAITSSGVCSNLPVFTASADTIDVEIHASGGTITGGNIRIRRVQ